MQTFSNRIRDLMMQHDVLTESELSMLTGVPQPTINRILSGATKTPRKAAMKALSTFFKVPVHSLFEANTPSSSSDDPLAQPGTMVPLYEWASLRHKLSTVDIPGSHPQHIVSFKKLEGPLFALVVHGDELEPKFSKGTILVFKKTNKFKNRDFILLMSENMPHLKQILIDGSYLYLKSLDSALGCPISKLDDLDLVIGLLVQSISEFGD